MSTFTFNTPSQQHLLTTRGQARIAAKAVTKILGLECTGADKKRVDSVTGDRVWSFDVKPLNVVRKKRPVKFDVISVEGKRLVMAA